MASVCSFLSPEAHVRWSEQMGKPLVVGAFTLSRDLASHDRRCPRHSRRLLCSRIQRADSLARAGRELGASASGAGAVGPPALNSPQNRLGWQAGNAFTGDPPSSPRLSVYSTDTSTCEVIQKYAATSTAQQEAGHECMHG